MSIVFIEILLKNYLQLAKNSLLFNYQEKIGGKQWQEKIIWKEIENIGKKIKNLTTTLENYSDSSAAKYIVAEIEKLDKQIAGLNYELREVEHKEIENNKISNDIGAIHAKICKYLDSFDELPYQDKVKYLKEIIKECVWDGKNLIVTI